jgi:hypothetical protein
MALKDWKKTKNEFKGELSLWKNKKTGIDIDIITINVYNKNAYAIDLIDAQYVVQVYDDDSEFEDPKGFKTRLQALKYAKLYMRTH